MARRFLLDVMLGKLATYLRMCGYDAAYIDVPDADDAISERATTTGRTLLTRDQELAFQTENVILLESREIAAQLAELQQQGIAIELPTEPDRCSVCNGHLNSVAFDQHPDHAPDAVDNVWQCGECEQCFWKGSHWERVRETIRSSSE